MTNNKHYTKTDIKWLKWLLSPLADVVCIIDPNSITFNRYIRYFKEGSLWQEYITKRSFDLLVNKGILISNGGNMDVGKGYWRYLRYYVPNPDIVFKQVNKQMKGKFSCER